MGRLFSALGFYLSTAVVLMADIPFKPIDANYQRSDMQWNLACSVGETPVIKATLYQGTNKWVGSGHTFKFRYGQSDSALAMATVTGVLQAAESNMVVHFQVQSNDFSKPVSMWYSAIVATSNAYTYTFAKGWLNLARSPEISAPGAMYVSYALNGSAYGPFLGSFAGWPFPTTNGASAYSVLYFDSAIGKYTNLPAGANGLFLQTRGTGTAPRWTDATSTGGVNQADFQDSNALHRAGIAFAQATGASNGAYLVEQGNTNSQQQTAISGLNSTNLAQDSAMTINSNRITVVETGKVDNASTNGWIVTAETDPLSLHINGDNAMQANLDMGGMGHVITNTDGIWFNSASYFRNGAGALYFSDDGGNVMWFGNNILTVSNVTLGADGSGSQAVRYSQMSTTLAATGTAWRAEWQNAANLSNYPTAYTPAQITSTASNVFSFAAGPIQRLRLTNTTVFYLPTNPDTSKVITARLELDPNGQTLMLSTNTILIGTNTVTGNGFTDFLTGLRTNKYNAMVIDYGLEMVTGRIFRLNF